MNSWRLKDAARSLLILKRDLELIIAPELKTPATQSTLAMIAQLIGMLSAELTADGAAHDPLSNAAESVVEALVDTDRVLARNIAALLQSESKSESDKSTLLSLLEIAAGNTLVSVNSSVWRIYAEIAEWRAIRDTGSSSSEWQTTYIESAAGSKSRPTQQSLDVEFTIEALSAYINETSRTSGTALIRSLNRLPGGNSKGTYFVDLDVYREGVLQRSESWVLRRDLSYTPLNTRVVDEFPLLGALYRLGIPVPEPLWCEADANRLGSAVIAVRRIKGDGNMAHWTKDLEQARSVVLSAARILARMHSIELSSLPNLQTEAPGSQGEVPRDVVDHVEKFWQSIRLEPEPLVELLFEWLRRNAPSPDRRSLVHGDFGLHNLLVDGVSVSGVLDWEFAHAGDPREDLAYAKPFVETVLPWSQFLREYENAGGVHSESAPLRFYAVLGALRNALGCIKILHAVRHDDPAINSKFIYVGRSYAQQGLRNAARLTGLL